MTTTTDEFVTGNATVIDFGAAKAAREAGSEVPDKAGWTTFSMQFVKWPPKRMRWLAHHFEQMGAADVAAGIRKMADEADGVA